MLITHLLARVDGQRLQKAVEGLVSGVYAISLASQSETELRGFVSNGDGKEYGVIIGAEQTFCSCKDAMYRNAICKHAVALALYAIRTPQAEPHASEERTPDLRLGKVRAEWSGRCSA